MGCAPSLVQGVSHIPYFIGTPNPTPKARGPALRHGRQLVGERAVAAPDDHIRALAQLEAAGALRPILEGHQEILDPEARGGGSAALGTVAARPRITALGGALAARATALEGEAEPVEDLLRARVEFCAGALVLNGAVPVQGKALERTQQLVRATGDHPRAIEIFHPQEPAAAAARGIDEAAHCGDQRAEVQRSCRGGREAPDIVCARSGFACAELASASGSD